MASSVTSIVQHYAQQFILQTLGSISEARLRFDLRYGGSGKTITVGDSDQASKEPETVLVINSPTFWVRVCSAFDLVDGN